MSIDNRQRDLTADVAAEALIETMVANDFRDEDVAVRLRCATDSVQQWRLKYRRMRPLVVNAMRQSLPGFEDRYEKLLAEKRSGAA